MREDSGDNGGNENNWKLMYWRNKINKNKNKNKNEHDNEYG
jgi:hypothetical protein